MLLQRLSPSSHFANKPQEIPAVFRDSSYLDSLDEQIKVLTAAQEHTKLKHTEEQLAIERLFLLSAALTRAIHPHASKSFCGKDKICEGVKDIGLEPVQAIFHSFFSHMVTRSGCALRQLDEAWTLFISLKIQDKSIPEGFIKAVLGQSFTISSLHVKMDVDVVVPDPVKVAPTSEPEPTSPLANIPSHISELAKSDIKKLEAQASELEAQATRQVSKPPNLSKYFFPPTKLGSMVLAT